MYRLLYLEKMNKIIVEIFWFVKVIYLNGLTYFLLRFMIWFKKILGLFKKPLSLIFEIQEFTNEPWSSFFPYNFWNMMHRLLLSFWLSLGG